MTNQKKLIAIKEAIEAAETIIIHRHVRPDPDAVGSQKGLAEIIMTSYPEKKVYTAGEMTEWLENLMGPMNPPEASDYDNALVIVTDTANTARLDGLMQIPNIDEAIKIDHHPDEEAYGALSWVDTQASSCSEMIAEFWHSFDDLKLTDQGAEYLYLGIVGDTNRFLYPATTPKTMNLAGTLMAFNFDHTAINNRMNTITPKIAHLMSHVFQNFKIIENQVGYIVFDQETMNQLGIEDSDTSQIVSLPGLIEGVLSWGIFVQQPEGDFRARLRSKGPVINEIAKNHGGGGHPLASGANAKDHNEIQEILAEFIETNDLFLNEE